MQRDPQVWQDADTFDPSRWASSPPRRSYAPFNAGPRICLGQAFAMRQIEGVVERMSTLELEVVDTAPAEWRGEPGRASIERAHIMSGLTLSYKVSQVADGRARVSADQSRREGSGCESNSVKRPPRGVESIFLHLTATTQEFNGCASPQRSLKRSTVDGASGIRLHPSIMPPQNSPHCERTEDTPALSNAVVNLV